MKKFALAQRVVLGLAVATTAMAPMAASARDGWGHDNGYRGGHDRGNWNHDRGGWGRDRGDWHHDRGYHGGHGNAGNWIAGAIVAATVAGIVTQAVAPAPTYYQPAPTYYQQAPTVVYRQPATVLYEQPQEGQVIYEQPSDGYQQGYQQGYQDGY